MSAFLLVTQSTQMFILSFLAFFIFRTGSSVDFQPSDSVNISML